MFGSFFTANSVKDSELIPVSKVIAELEEQKITLGRKGSDPYNTLRYYTKIGLLPYMTRKYSESDQSVVGHYPRDVIGRIKLIEEMKLGGYSNEDIAAHLHTIYAEGFFDKLLALTKSKQTYITVFNLGLWIILVGYVLNQGSSIHLKANGLDKESKTSSVADSALVKGENVAIDEVCQLIYQSDKRSFGFNNSPGSFLGQLGDESRETVEINEEIKASSLLLLQEDEAGNTSLSVVAEGNGSIITQNNPTVCEQVVNTQLSSNIIAAGTITIAAGETEAMITHNDLTEGGEVYLSMPASVNISYDLFDNQLIVRADTMQDMDLEIQWMVK